MSVQAREILKNFITCLNEETRNKYYNLLDSFWHKAEGKIIKTVNKDEDGKITGLTVVDLDGNTEVMNLPSYPTSQPISFITGLQTELNKLVEKIPGKTLTTNDLTDELLQKLNDLNNYQHPQYHQISEIENLAQALTDLEVPEGLGYSEVNFTTAYEQKLLSYPINHYAAPVADLAALALIPEQDIPNFQRRPVQSEKVDYFYDRDAVEGDVAPDDQTEGTGFWVKVIVEQTPQQIVSAIDSLIGTDWKTQRTVEFIQDVVGAMFQTGNHVNISTNYDDVNGSIDITGSSGGTGGGFDQEAVEDIVGNLIIPEFGINAVYDDVNNAIRLSIQGEIFTTSYKNKIDANEAAITALQTGKEKKRTKKVVNNTTQYTVIAADFTDFELHFTGDTSGDEIDVIINTGVCPNTEPSTGLQIVSEANHVLNYTGTATLTTQAGALKKTANDGSSVAISGVKPLSGVNDLGLFGSLQSDGSGVDPGGELNVQADWDETDDTSDAYIKNKPTSLGETYDVVTNTENGLIKAPNITVGATNYSPVITSPSEGFTYTPGDSGSLEVDFDLNPTTQSSGKSVFKYDKGTDSFDWEDEVSAIEKFDSGIEVGTASPEISFIKLGKWLSFEKDGAITFKMGMNTNVQTWYGGVEIQGSNINSGNLTIAGANHITILYPSTKTNEIIQNGYFRIKFISDNVALLTGDLANV
ncbi:hypothetical protein ML462_14105 [Gramella lutea]|uniref:Uncharacterized protein n=1 Tax=Christiangramia lutea TaxID=1607951 RepID=A0A9X2AAB6_9FLAO|nr:hypothetical protein [Christiangramia lutea]MCH4824305.1 hypothetical protein [Christiangramia lutea]